MLIRKYSLSKCPPIKRIIDLVGEVNCYWRQSDEIPDDIRQYFLSQVPSFRTLGEPTIGIHCTSDPIPRHRDGNSKSAFIFPIRYGKTTRFVVEDCEVAFEPMKMYRFNDFNYHQVENPNFAHVILVKVRF
jgi:hypothetical protein